MRRLAFSATAVVAVLVGLIVHASILTLVSDLITDSAPNAFTSHTIQFTVTNAIPPSGKIIITPHVALFTIPPSFDYTDVDLAVSSGAGPYIDRDIAGTADAVNDGVSVVTGNTGHITITLNSSTGIAAGDSLQIRLGTVATVGAVGTDNIQNPFAPGSYRMDFETRDATNALIDRMNTLDAIVYPVALSVKAPIVAPLRTNGLPSGLVAANSNIIELSLNTSIPSHCRYATTTDVLYQDMTFNFSPVSGTTHFVNTTGYSNDTTYNFYVRCISTTNLAANDDDYLISFALKPTPSSNTSIENEGFVTNGPQGNLGSGGVGDFPNGSSVLYLASVTFTGFTVPNSQVTVLKDGTKAVNVQSKADGSFKATVAGLERGAYGFQMYVEDGRGLASALYGTTLTVQQGTDNNITNIVIPPTIQLSADSVIAGDPLTVSGGAPPGVKVQLTVTGESGTAGTALKQTFSATSSSSGDWSIDVDTSQLTKGTYALQAVAIEADNSKSGVSKTATLAVDAAGSGGKCGAPDMNADGKVNLVDFSIFLLSWGTTDSKADFSCDGTVNLSDFSIMLFNWTG
jgi:hypothetical protein